MSHRNIFLILMLLFQLPACIEDPETDPAKQGFTKIYDDSNFSASQFPIDVAETSEGGFLILGGRTLDDTNFSGIYILKADQYGNFVRSLEVDENFVNPVGDLMNIGANYYFLCMDPVTLQTHIAMVDANAETFTATPVTSFLPYPAAAAVDNNNILALSYNPVDKESVVSILSKEGTVTSSEGYTIGAGEGVEEPIINHFLRTGEQFPFQVGKAGSTYFFNGFYNYTFSLAFVNLTQDTPVGVVYGQQDDGGFSAIAPITANKFATAQFNFGDNYLLPNVNLNMNGISSSTDLGGYTLPELDNNATVKILRAVLKSKNILVYGCDTKSNQIGLYFYDETTGNFLNSQYVGYSNPFKIASVKQTSKGDLIICGTTYLAGRFPRYCLIKINQKDITL